MNMSRKDLLSALIFLCVFETIIIGIWAYNQGAYQYYTWFFVPVIFYAFAYYLNSKNKTTTAFYITNSLVNILMLMFDGGLLSFTKEFVYYIPIIISCYVFVPYESKKSRVLLITSTILCILLCTFTDLTPRIKEKMYLATGYGQYLAAFNVVVALTATIMMLRYIIHSFKKNERILIDTNNKLSESERKYDFALNVSLDGLWDWDIKNNKTWYSKKWKEILGYSEDELGNDAKQWETLIHPDDKDFVISVLDNYVKGGADFYECEYRIRCRDGSYKWIVAQGKASEYDTKGGIKKIIGTHKDITELKISQRQLKKNQQLLESINQNITEAIYRSTPSGEVVYSNRAFSKMFQLDEDTIKNNISAINYADPKEKERLMRINDEKGHFYNEEVLFKKSDGTEFWGLVSSYKLINENGNIYYDGAIRDITNIKEFEAELVRAKELAEEASETKSNFLSTMSHEMRTPLNAVIGFTELLSNTELTKEQNEYLNLIKFSGSNLVGLINDILDSSKIESGKLELEEQEFSLHDLLNNISNNFEAQALRKGIRFRSNINLRNYNNVISDPHRLTQIISNLLSNAIKFTDKGEVYFEAICKGFTNGKAIIHFMVQDSGVGIADVHLKKIFEPFTQATNNIARKFGGSGLGLSITKSLLNLFGGNIHVESTLGEGSRFYFSLNIVCSDTKSITFNTRKVEVIENKLKGLRILAVDDNEVNLTLIHSMLKQFEVDADLASSGEEAIKISLEKNYDIVIMDLHMPDMDGFETTRRIKLFNAELPIIALTADTLDISREKAKSVGMYDFILKPINSEYLRNALLKVNTMPHSISA